MGLLYSDQGGSYGYFKAKKSKSIFGTQRVAVGNTSLRGGKLTSTTYRGFRMVFDGRKCRHIFSRNFCLIYDKKFNLANITSYRTLINGSTEFSISRPSLNSKQTLNCIIGHWCGRKVHMSNSYRLMN